MPKLNENYLQLKDSYLFQRSHTVPPLTAKNTRTNR